MKIAIVVDASLQIGLGHLMRCMTLALELKPQKAQIAFFCHELTDAAREMLTEQQFDFFVYHMLDPKLLAKTIHEFFGEKIDWLIIDNYKIDYLFEHQLRDATRKIFIIDDLANRKHDADILLDQNYYMNLEERYQNLVSEKCKLLLGPTYVLLRDQFYQARKSLPARSSKIQRIFLFYGGTDPDGHTLDALTTLIDLVPKNILIDVVVGMGNPQKEQIKNFSLNHSNIQFHCPAENIVELMLLADLAIGSGGTAMWERAFLGLPSVVQIIAKNQFETTTATGQLGAIYNISWGDRQSLSQAVYKCLNNPKIIDDMIASCFKLFPNVDECGKGLIVKEMNKTLTA